MDRKQSEVKASDVESLKELADLLTEAVNKGIDCSGELKKTVKALKRKVQRALHLKIGPSGTPYDNRSRDKESVVSLLCSLEMLEKLFSTFNMESSCHLRDRAMAGLMLYACATPANVTQMQVQDFIQDSGRAFFCLTNRQNVKKHVPAHPLAEEYVCDFLAKDDLDLSLKENPLFPKFNKKDSRNEKLSGNTLGTILINHSKKAGLPKMVTPFGLRATGMVASIQASGSLKEASSMLGGYVSDRTLEKYSRIAVESAPQDLHTLFDDFEVVEDIRSPLSDFTRNEKIFDVDQ